MTGKSSSRLRRYSAPSVERKWRERWQQARCFHVVDRPSGVKFYNFDSGPFPNGPLHLGHVRTYALGDMTARYQRLLGKSVLYATEWDAFGLPNELEPFRAGVSPRDFTSAQISQMRQQLMQLGISYDWSRVRATCDPDYYRWTQWLFLLLLRRGLAYRRRTSVPWCARCQTSVGDWQTVQGDCWRCDARVTRRVSFQWFVEISRYSRRLIEGIEDLGGWSATGKRLLLRSCAAEGQQPNGPSNLADWHVSRQRSWGTPIPVVLCPRCGIVPARCLPVELPGELEWSSGPGALARCTSFVHTPCPQCGGDARRETDTLDCFFDDAWSYLSCFNGLFAEGRAEFPSEEVRHWFPVDRFHSGFDTFTYLNLYRFVGMLLSDEGWLPQAEPISSYMGHDMVVSGGRKISKRIGNAASLAKVLKESGADALRVAVLWAASPRQTIEWDGSGMARATSLLDRIFRLYASCADAVTSAPRQSVASGTPSRGLASLERAACGHFSRIGRFFGEYRPNAALDEIYILLRRIEDFAVHRVESGRLLAMDREPLFRLLQNTAVTLSPVAPFLAEEITAMIGPSPLVTSRWPDSKE